MVHTAAEEFAAEVKTLCETTVTDSQWSQFLDAHIPFVDDKGDKLTGRSLTIAHNKRSTINKLYRLDLRVAPWAGTAHGVLQAVNTYEHHENAVRGGDRGERNMLRTVSGEFGNIDRSTWATLSKILA